MRLAQSIGFVLVGAGIATAVIDLCYLHPEWSYGGGLLSLGLLIVCLTWLESL